MKNYAVITDDIVINTIIWDGETEFYAGNNQEFIDITHMTDKPGIGWSYVDGVFTPPPEQEKTMEALIAEANSKKSVLLATANAAIVPLQDAVDLNIATDAETSLLTEWRKYRVLLSRIDTSAVPDIEWPTQPGIQAS